jgi:DNA-binding Lrp family transcriptional regulator
MHAFILMDIQPGMENQVLSSLKRLDKVTEAYIIFGKNDLIIKVQYETREELWYFITNEIRTLDGAKGTLTLIPLYGFKR